MSYSDLDRITYTYPAVAFGSGDTTQAFRGPKGKTGRLLRAHLHPTTTFAGATTNAKVQVGPSGTLTAKMNWDVGTPAAGTAVATDDSTQTSNPISDPELAADTTYLVTLKAPTGGGAAGVGTVEIVVGWSW